MDIQYDVDLGIKMYHTESAAKDDKRFVTLELDKIRDQNSAGFKTSCDLIRNAEFPYFEEAENG